MKRIRIFIASSITDLKFDRIEIGNFFRQLNDIYIESGVYFDLVMCEDYDNGIALEGKQSELDRLLCESELVFFIFFNKVGDYTKHEFEVALDNYKNVKKPKIVTYFKCVEDAGEVTGDVAEFMAMLDSELRHYYNIYREIDTLKLGMFMQIKLMRLDSSELKIEDGALMHGKTKIAETKNIPMFECNDRLKKLTEELSRSDERYRMLKVAFLRDGTDDAYLAFSEAASEKDRIEKELHDLECEILKAAEKMYEVTTDGRVLSEKQRQAYRYMEKGEWSLALAILDRDEIMNEISHNEALADGIRERLSVNANELVQRIGVLKAAGLDRDSIDEILSLYETVYELVQKHDLDLDPIYDYCLFLHELDYNDQAIKVSEKLTYLYSDPDRKTDLAKKAELMNLRGKICVGLKRYDQALDILEEGIGYADELMDTRGDEYAVLCADMRNISANAHFFLHDKELAKRYYENAKELYERAYAYDSKYKFKIAMISDNYGGSLCDVGMPEAGLAYHLKGERIYMELCETDEKYKASLSRCRHNTALCYKKLGDYEKSRQYFLRSIVTREEIREKNPSSIEALLSGTYYSLGLLYRDEFEDREKAKEAFYSSIRIRTVLRKRSVTYARELKSAYYAIAYSSAFESEQKEKSMAEYIDTLMSLEDLCELERRELCEEGISYAGYKFIDDERRYEVIKKAFEIFIEEGDRSWCIYPDFARMGFMLLAAKLDRLEEYNELSSRFMEKYNEGMDD